MSSRPPEGHDGRPDRDHRGGGRHLEDHVRPTLDEVRGYARTGEYRTVPVACEILSDQVTPIEALRRLRRVSDRCFLLESAEPGASRGRYTFLGYDPVLELSARDGVTTVRTKDGSPSTSERATADVVRSVLADHVSPRVAGLPPFAGGLVGYFSFDYFGRVEPTAACAIEDDGALCDVDLMLFDKVVAFDSYRQRVVLVTHVDVRDETSLEFSYHREVSRLRSMRALVEHGSTASGIVGRMTTPLVPRLDEASYCDMVRRAQRRIREGDVFQVVLSNQFEAGFDGSLLDAYRVLRTTNPSPYMFYLVDDDLELAGASPETLVKLEGRDVRTFPLAGSRPRGRTPEEDEALARELLADKKELAEHNMLVDLGRNDLGRICELGSVAVERHLDVQRYSHVMHLGSEISGHLRDGLDAMDAIGSTLPAGTLSGAPKIRACQIIAELEGDRRGVYGGAIGYIDLAGDLDACIGIRFACRHAGRVSVRSGAGIVAGSIPEREYQECLNKARAVVEALEAAQGGVGA